jgi:RNA polymerase sigma-70 factor (ECF subfamily)
MPKPAAALAPLAAAPSSEAVDRPRAIAARFPLAPDAAARLVHAEIGNPRTRARLVASAVRILGNEADAEDCVQEALVLAARNAAQFEGRSSATSWLFRVVLNACRMQKRALRRERRGGGAVHLSIDDLVGQHPASELGDDPEAIVVGRDTLEILDRALATVAPLDAALFRRHVAEDLPLKDLAREVDLTRQAVKSRLFRVRRRLADALVEGGHAEPNVAGA